MYSCHVYCVYKNENGTDEKKYVVVLLIKLKFRLLNGLSHENKILNGQNRIASKSYLIETWKVFKLFTRNINLISNIIVCILIFLLKLKGLGFYSQNRSKNVSVLQRLSVSFFREYVFVNSLFVKLYN